MAHNTDETLIIYFTTCVMHEIYKVLIIHIAIIVRLSLLTFVHINKKINFKL